MVVDYSQPPKMVHFNGENPLDWILQVERYFFCYFVSDSLKLTLASSFIEGEARDWFCLLSRNNAFQNWDHFVDELLIRFCNRTREAPNVTELSTITASAQIHDNTCETTIVSSATTVVSTLDNGFSNLVATPQVPTKKLDNLLDATVSIARLDSNLGNKNSGHEDQMFAKSPDLTEIQLLKPTIHKELSLVSYGCSMFDKLSPSEYFDTGQGLSQGLITLEYSIATVLNEEAENMVNNTANVVDRKSNMISVSSGTKVLIPYPLRLLHLFNTKEVLHDVQVFEHFAGHFAINDFSLVHVPTVLYMFLLTPLHGDLSVNFKDDIYSVFVDEFASCCRFEIGLPRWNDFRMDAACLKLLNKLYCRLGSDTIHVKFHIAATWLSRVPKISMANEVSSIRKYVYAAPLSVVFGKLTWDEGFALIIKQPLTWNFQLVVFGRVIRNGYDTWVYTTVEQLHPFGNSIYYPCISCADLVEFLGISLSVHHLLHHFPFDPGVTHSLVTPDETLMVPCMLYSIPATYDPGNYYWWHWYSIPPDKILLLKARGKVHYIYLHGVVGDLVTLDTKPAHDASRTQLRGPIIYMLEFHNYNTLGFHWQDSRMAINFRIPHPITQLNSLFIPFARLGCPVSQEIERSLLTTYPFDPGKFEVALNNLGAVDLHAIGDCQPSRSYPWRGSGNEGVELQYF